MRQLTLRVDDSLVESLKQSATARGESVNTYAQAVLSAAVNPELAGDEASQLRERLNRAGLLALSSATPRRPPDKAALARARKRAGRGKSLASFVVEDRS